MHGDFQTQRNLCRKVVMKSPTVVEKKAGVLVGVAGTVMNPAMRGFLATPASQLGAPAEDTAHMKPLKEDDEDDNHDHNPPKSRCGTDL